MTKSIQFGHELRLTVKVVPDRLRAGTKPLEGKLTVETNGGVATIKVRAEVPVKPFPPGVLAGAKSPRAGRGEGETQAQGGGRPLRGRRAWRRGTRTMAGPIPCRGRRRPVSGGAAVLRVLGLTPAPKVQISERQIALKGSPGASLRHVIKVETQDKKPVFAHGTSNQPWLEVSRARLTGRTATINLAIPAVPNRPGETLTAQLVVQSNGNQRFVVPVTLRVNGHTERHAASDDVGLQNLADVVEGATVEPIDRHPRTAPGSDADHAGRARECGHLAARFRHADADSNHRHHPGESGPRVRRWACSCMRCRRCCWHSVCSSCCAGM